ncbi:MAG: hypothetical protein A2X94_12460 [Bdellovibrionales bacterium GWB1_55_8]|nr:MAG: hypothetical protein A2X94_12460 [Bdellovibrionales bacterium GWB1_55_8]
MVASIVLSSSGARAQSQFATTSQRMPIYKEQDTSSQVLGTYAPGSKVRVKPTSNPEWMEIQFSRPVKGTSVGYARASAFGSLKRPSTAPGAAAVGNPSSGSSLKKYRGTISLGADGVQAKPSAALVALGEASASVPVLQFRAKGSYFWSERFLAYAHVGYDSFTHINEAAVKTLYGSAFEGMAGVQYLVMRNRFMDLMVGAGAGASMYSVSTLKALTATSSLVGLQFEIPRLTVLVPLFSSLALELNAGYQMKTLSGVTVVTGGTVAEPETVLTDIGFGGLFGGLQLAWVF